MSRDAAGLAAVSLTWREAPSAVRGRLTAPLGVSDLERLGAQGLRGVVAIHTCARSLWIISGEHAAWTGALLQSLVARRIADGALAGEARLLPILWTHDAALRHVLSVVVGLDSLVEGEADIGGQCLEAFQHAHDAGHTDALLHIVWQAMARIQAAGREQSFIRPNRGMGALAVDLLRRLGADARRPVGVVGAGAIGGRVVAALDRAAWPRVIYNRSPGPGTLPLSAIAGHEALVVCTAGPERWFKAPPEARFVVDLGLPSQVAGANLGLDRLLVPGEASEAASVADLGLNLRLPSALRARAELAVEREMSTVLTRVRAQQWAHSLERLNQERDTFVRERLEAVMADAVAELSPEQRRRVLQQSRQAIRQLTYSLIEALKDELADPEAPAPGPPAPSPLSAASVEP